MSKMEAKIYFHYEWTAMGYGLNFRNIGDNPAESLTVELIEWHGRTDKYQLEQAFPSKGITLLPGRQRGIMAALAPEGESEIVKERFCVRFTDGQGPKSQIIEVEFED